MRLRFFFAFFANFPEHEQDLLLYYAIFLMCRKQGLFMRLDGHVHIMEDCGDPVPDFFRERCEMAGIDGGVVISLPPASFRGKKETRQDFEARLDNLFLWSAAGELFFPFFWLDPLADNAPEQVAAAKGRGVKGFKVICDAFYPYDERALKIFRLIADVKLPILFHSGILWDGKASSIYNRPLGFEALIDIEGLKFSLAHIAWPWCDELIAVYGKFQNAYFRRPDISVEMFIDITPGTPAVYRNEVLTKLFSVGYDVENNVIFGSDSTVGKYNFAWTREWLERDNGIYGKLDLTESVVNGIYSDNLLRFLGEKEGAAIKKSLRSGA